MQEMQESRFDPWIRKNCWRRKWQPTPVFLPGKFHGQRSLVGSSPRSLKRGGHNLATKQQQQYPHKYYCLISFIHSLTQIFIKLQLPVSQSGSVGKESSCKAGDPGLIPGSGRSPGEGNGNPLQYSCLENSMSRGAGQATVHGIAKSQTRLRD